MFARERERNNFSSFHAAQHRDDKKVKHELGEDGKKSSHWIWYIFPQLKELGYSDTAKFYGLLDLNEACAYLSDAILFAHYQAMTALVLEKLNQGIDVETLMNGEGDAGKLSSSVTLFQLACKKHMQDPAQTERDKYQNLMQTCENILAVIAPQGFPACQRTLRACANDLSPSLPAPQVLAPVSNHLAPPSSCDPILPSSRGLSVGSTSPVAVKTNLTNPPLSTLSPERQQLITALEAYMRKIDKGHLIDDSKDYRAFGNDVKPFQSYCLNPCSLFWSNTNRAKNRRANYQLANKLIQSLRDPSNKPIDVIFKKSALHKIRYDAGATWTPQGTTGIWSDDLAKVVHQASKTRPGA